MGKPRDIVNQLDPSNEVQAGLKQTIEALMKLGEAKANIFDMEIKESIRTSGTEENKKIPVEAIVDDTQEIRSLTKEEAKNIGNVVKSALTDFINGGTDGIINGVSNLISSGLETFLGAGTSESREMQKYYVVREGLSLVRLDIRSWYLNTTTQGIKELMEQIVVVKAVKSIVDLSQINVSTFIYFYQQQMNAAGMSYDEVIQELEQVKKIQEIFVNSHGNTLKSRREVVIPPNTEIPC